MCIPFEHQQPDGIMKKMKCMNAKLQQHGYKMVFCFGNEFLDGYSKVEIFGHFSLQEAIEPLAWVA